VTSCARPERVGAARLRESVGFHVVDPRGRCIGRIDEVMVSDDARVVDAIVVRSGLFGRRISLLSPESLAEVIPALRTVVTEA
jgi:hypothetical protein